MVLLGMVPVLMQQPPRDAIFSISATRFPSFAPWMAARCPAGPEPITIRSKVCMTERFIVLRVNRRGQPDAKLASHDPRHSKAMAGRTGCGKPGARAKSVRAD